MRFSPAIIASLVLCSCNDGTLSGGVDAAGPGPTLLDRGSITDARGRADGAPVDCATPADATLPDQGILGDVAALPDAGAALDAAAALDGTAPLPDQGPPPTTFFHVRAGATGAKDGSSWTAAFVDLPPKLVRGATYYVAAGSYAGRTFDDPDAGTLAIAIKKATAAEHGSSVGWQAAFGQGQAVFGPLVLAGNYYRIDGQGPGGIKTLGEFKGRVVDAKGDHLVLRHVEMNGAFATTGGVHTGGACNVLHTSGTDVAIERCELHNAADDGAVIRGKDIQLLQNQIHTLYGCGTDGGCAGPCFNGHSDGLEIYAPTNLTLVGNVVYDVRQTSGMIILPDASGALLTNLVMKNNIFYTPATGLAVYIRLVQGAKVYNNIIWGQTSGSRYGGLGIGPQTTDLDLRNNIILSINYDHMGATFDPAEHKIDHNRFGVVAADQYPLAAHDTVGDPQFAVIPFSADLAQHKTSDLLVSDFYPKPGSPTIDQGAALAGVVDQDLEGAPRPRDGDGDGAAAWDLGAFERAP